VERALLFFNHEDGCQCNLESRALENLPLSNYRNYQNLITCSGRHAARFQNAVIDTPQRSL